MKLIQVRSVPEEERVHLTFARSDKDPVVLKVDNERYLTLTNEDLYREAHEQATLADLIGA